MRWVRMRIEWYFVTIIHLLSHVWFFVTPWTAARQDSLSFTISWSVFKLKSIELAMLPTISSCHSLFLLPSIFPRIKVFPSESALCIRWPKYWSFSFSISPSKEYSGLISFRIHWFDILAIQETLKNLLKCHSLKISILQAQPSLWSNSHPRASLIAQLVKNLPAMQETLFWFLGLEDPLEKGRLPTPVFLGVPCGSAGKKCRRPGFDPWVGKIPWRKGIHSSILAWRIPQTV